MNAADSLAAQRVSKFGAYLPSLEAAYTVGHVVVSQLLSHWPRFATTIPGDAQAAPRKP
jgi:purine nucleoside permease